MIGKRRTPRKVPRSKASKRRRTNIAGAVVLAGLAVGGAKMLHNKSVKSAAEERKIVNSLRIELTGLKAVRNPSQFANLCRIYGWNPSNPKGAARIRFIEKVSRTTKVSPARIMATIEQNTISVGQARALQNKIMSLEARISRAERDRNSGGYKGRAARGEIKDLSKRLMQVDRVAEVVEALLKNPELAKNIHKEAMGTRGSLRKVQGLP